MKISSKAVYEWRKRTKTRIVEAMGSKCVCCKYDRYIGSFDLHHLDRNTKKAIVSSFLVNIKSWADIVKELRKCVLVCANCHREIEGGVRALPEKYTRFNEKYVEYRTFKGTYTKICLVCEKQYKTENNASKYCSRKCGGISKRKNYSLGT